MAGRDLSRLCQSILPPEFERLRRQLPRIQEFLDTNMPEAVQGCVTVLSMNEEEIVIAANTPMVANYLRLHSAEIQQQLRESFQLKQTVRFRTIPDALLKPRKREPLQAARAVSAEAVNSIKLNAQWIEDETLRDALLALADSLAAMRDEQ
jgi:hypothetical protein